MGSLLKMVKSFPQVSQHFTVFFRRLAPNGANIRGDKKFCFMQFPLPR
jgi:hypothetical protein